MPMTTGRPEWGVCLLVISSMACSNDRPQSQPPEVLSLVQQLSSERFRERQAAYLDLRRLGLCAAPELHGAMQSSDPDIRRRAAELLRHVDSLKAREQFESLLRTKWTPALVAGRLEPPFAGSLGETRLPTPRTLEEATGSGVAGALGFMARAQEADGHWDSQTLGAQYPADVEQTSLALLSFLSGGHTERVGEFKFTVRKAVVWLIERQCGNGELCGMDWEGADTTTHTLGTMALCEAAAMGNQPGTKEAAQRAVDYLASLQDSETGGFRRSSDVLPDLLTTSLAVQALRSAKIAGLNVRFETFDGIMRFLESVEARDGSSFAFVIGGSLSPEATLFGTVSRMYLGWKFVDLFDEISLVSDAFLSTDRIRGQPDVLTGFFLTQFMLHQPLESWHVWQPKRDGLLATGQFTEGSWAGACRPQGVWAGCGLLFQTALSSAACEIYPRWRNCCRR